MLVTHPADNLRDDVISTLEVLSVSPLIFKLDIADAYSAYDVLELDSFAQTQIAREDGKQWLT